MLEILALTNQEMDKLIIDIYKDNDCVTMVIIPKNQNYETSRVVFMQRNFD